MIKNRKEVTLSEIMDFKNGLNFTKSDNGEKIKIVGVSDFKDLAELSSTENLDVISISSKIKDDELLKDGDLLFVRSNGNKELIGRCLYFPTVTERLSFSGFTIRGRVKDKNVLPAYIAQLARSSLIKKEINKNGGGTNISNLSQQILNAIVIKLPEYVEQIKIVEILSTWDNAIQTTEKLLENSRRQKKALMQRLLNGKDWEETKLQNLCKIVTGKKDVNEGNDKGIYPFFTCAKEHTYSDSYSFECEALLIAGNGVVGQTTYYKGKFEAYQRTYVLYEFKGINVQYLYQYIKWHLQKDIEREKQHGAMPYIKLGLLTDFVVKLPKSNEQQKIAEILSTADQEIETLQRKLECLKLEKGALMQRFL